MMTYFITKKLNHQRRSFFKNLIKSRILFTFSVIMVMLYDVLTLSWLEDICIFLVLLIILMSWSSRYCLEENEWQEKIIWGRYILITYCYCYSRCYCKSWERVDLIFAYFFSLFMCVCRGEGITFSKYHWLKNYNSYKIS